MDLASIIGIVSGVVFVLITILLSGDLITFFNLPSIMIVVGGTIAATLINFPLGKVMEVMNVVKIAFFHKEESPVEIIDTMVSLAERARREGILAIEKSISDLDDPFMKDGMQLAVDGSEPEIIRTIMQNELENLENRHKTGQRIFHQMGTFAPAFGMIGTLIGLINMLKSLDDPTQIGAGMAVALITTLYGALMANLIFLPLEGKLKQRSVDETVKREMIIEGILAIQSGDNPRIVRGKLLTFVAPKDRTAEEA